MSKITDTIYLMCWPSWTCRIYYDYWYMQNTGRRTRKYNHLAPSKWVIILKMDVVFDTKFRMFERYLLCFRHCYLLHPLPAYHLQVLIYGPVLELWRVPPLTADQHPVTWTGEDNIRQLHRQGERWMELLQFVCLFQVASERISNDTEPQWLKAQIWI